jgi:hypothetical protein
VELTILGACLRSSRLARKLLGTLITTYHLPPTKIEPKPRRERDGLLVRPSGVPYCSSINFRAALVQGRCCPSRTVLYSPAVRCEFPWKARARGGDGVCLDTGGGAGEDTSGDAFRGSRLSARRWMRPRVRRWIAAYPAYGGKIPGEELAR